eukprot:3326749-Rhodomonas_salina.3
MVPRIRKLLPMRERERLGRDRHTRRRRSEVETRTWTRSSSRMACSFFSIASSGIHAWRSSQ